MRDLDDADGRQGSCCLPVSQLLYTSPHKDPWSLGEDLHVYSHTRVGGLGDVVTACVLAVCLAHAQKVLSLTRPLLSVSYVVWKSCV